MDAQSSGTLQSPSTYSGSSKTGSTRSGETDKAEVDLTKDNAASPIDLECHIQAERITKILDEAVYKTKLALCLPNLVQEYRTLSSILTPQHMDDLIFIFEQYDNPLFSTSLLNMAAMEDIKGGDVSLKNRLNPELGHLMYIMNSYPALRPKVEEMIQEMKDEFTEAGEAKQLSPGLEYLQVLEHFRDLMVRQMNTSAAEELTEKLNTRKLEASNEKLIAKIREYTDNLKAESQKFEETMAMKADIISKLEKELAVLNFEADVKLKKKILDSDRQMVLATRAHIVKNELLKEEEVESKEMYENLLRAHLIEEKNQRARRFKVETQLLSWLQKYDLEMGDKQVELDEFTEKYDDELEKCDNLEIKLAEQDKEYIPLMAEREEEYHQEMTAKMNKFIVEHAARVIQSAWREVLANRAEKKKLKKKQKQMQLAQELAERRAAAQAAAEKKAAKKEAKGKK
ncbi:dynein regulatory complex protein 10-like [Maniola jurtina]|uniref:dynein regulatory complex protein 10-like n=1 Tax=Maniola jurtina TaxID=191418 RepID=UPI001E68E989|nr:dynein regulatory complex protein 10-like [Maniola jurtina]XP_045772441.1 dynein regulatory complex protein 10-like [Maniola jurtina]